MLSTQITRMFGYLVACCACAWAASVVSASTSATAAATLPAAVLLTAFSFRVSRWRDTTSLSHRGFEPALAIRRELLLGQVVL